MIEDEMNGSDLMKLPELALKAGVSNSTVYDYLRSGLLQPPFKKSPTKSFFTDEHLERLKKIREFREQGLSIGDILDYFGKNRGERGSLDLHESVRIEIIDKALELFSKYHYDRTKISDITKALNIGSGTFYRYFQSKEELFLGCLKRLPVVLVPHDAWKEVEKETDFIMRLKKRGYAMLNAFPSYIGILNYAKQALGAGDPVLAAKAAECIKALIAPLKNDLEIAIGQGMVRKDIDIEMCAYLLLGINEIFGYRRIIEPDCSVEDGFASIGDFVTHALALYKKKSPEGIVSALLTDKKGAEIDLKNLEFNGSKSITGKYSSGSLTIFFTDIMSILFEKKGEVLMAGVKCKNGTSVDIEISEEDVFKGVAGVGSFSVRGAGVKNIVIRSLTDA